MESRVSSRLGTLPINFAQIGYDKSFNEDEMTCNFNRCTCEVFTCTPKGDIISKIAIVVKMQIDTDRKTKINI